VLEQEELRLDVGTCPPGTGREPRSSDLQACVLRVDLEVGGAADRAAVRPAQGCEGEDLRRPRPLEPAPERFVRGPAAHRDPSPDLAVLRRPSELGLVPVGERLEHDEPPLQRNMERRQAFVHLAHDHILLRAVL
jgi:hypothetical protein